MRDALLFARDKGFSKIEVKGDSKLVIGTILGKVKTPWRLLSIVSDIRGLSSYFDVIQFKHIYREPNFVADAIAKLGHNCNRSLRRNFEK